jgi:2',5'-phosphodiesterase
MDVAVPFVLRSADDLATPYTNYTSGYKVRADQPQ